ncbi:MAG TPA: 4Fe-4S binding protein, partial [Chitinophagaceae bacterium]|nr:4Fe-4S binding protein [Chitinophagaceae bacterium]
PNMSKNNEFKSAFNLIEMLIPHFSRKSSKKNMCHKYVDESLCNKCGVCIRKCPYHAIEMKEFPVFYTDKCFGCWACYNLCPKKAVYTNKLRDKGHYNISNEALCKKLIIQ